MGRGVRCGSLVCPGGYPYCWCEVVNVRQPIGYILYEGAHYPIRRTDRNENCRTKRDNPPCIDYSKLGDDHK